MSGRLCCYKQQQHSKLLEPFVFKASAFRFNTRMKMCAILPDCHINISNKVQPSGTRGSGNYASPCMLILILSIFMEQAKIVNIHLDTIPLSLL